MIGSDDLVFGGMRAEALSRGIGLRDVAAGGEMLLRGLQFVVRDTNWGTYPLAATSTLRRTPATCALVFTGRLDTADGDLEWEARFVLRRGGIDAQCVAVSRRGFATNRTGLVLLHDLPAARGMPAIVTHPDGRITEAAFPTLVAPHQPFVDIARLDHISAGGHRVAIRFDGEVFETEDQRNWTDASFKTYSRPLARGHPYRIEPGARVAQSIAVDISAGAATDAAPFVRVEARLPDFVDAPKALPGPFADFNRAPHSGHGFAWSVSPTVHAADDDTIGETVESLPDLVATARAHAPGARLRVGPIRLETQFGDAEPAPDPRRGSVLEAAWVLGTIAGLLDPAVDALAFHRPEGAALHLLARLAAWRGAGAQSIAWPGMRRVRGLVLNGGARRVLAIAHLRAAPAEIMLPPGEWGVAERLDPAGFQPIAPGVLLAAKGFAVLWLTERP